jgi:hypothetical protein
MPAFLYFFGVAGTSPSRDTLALILRRHIMKTFYLTAIFALTINLAFGQRDTITSETNSTIQTNYTWKGACCDSYGKPLNPGDAMSQVYSVKKFKSKTPIDINIKSVKLGSQTINLDIHYQDNIEGDTKIINLNDSTGIKLTIAKTVENGTKKYLYKLQVFKKDKESNCWRPLTNSMSFFDVYSQTMSLNLFSIGYPDTKDYFQIVEGWIKFD